MRKYLRNITVGAALLLLAGSCTINLRSIIRINIKFMMQTLRL